MPEAPTPTEALPPSATEPKTIPSENFSEQSPSGTSPNKKSITYWKGKIHERVAENMIASKRFGTEYFSRTPRDMRHSAVKELKLEQKVAINTMTGLLNRDIYLAERDRTIGTYNRDVSMPEIIGIRFDIDDFGTVNKQYGDEMGDRILGEVGSAVRSTVRESDIAGRVGGEEFEVTAPKTVNPTRDTLSGSSPVAEKIRTAIEQMPQLIDHPITVSVGFTNYIKGEPIKTYQNRLIEAQIAAKKRGKNRTMEGLVINGENIFKELTSGTMYRLTRDDKGKITGIMEIK